MVCSFWASSLTFAGTLMTLVLIVVLLSITVVECVRTS